jgi:hypothetical protein
VTPAGGGNAGALPAFRPGLDGEQVAAALETLACDLSARPGSAPHFSAVEHAVRSVQRVQHTLVVDYDPAVAATLEAIVAAERLCCPELGWQLEAAGPDVNLPGEVRRVRLTIAGTPEQVETAALLFPRRAAHDRR